MAKTYDLSFDYICSDANKKNLPKYPGIYVVYEGETLENGTIRAKRVVYIGEAADINARHNEDVHEHYKDFIRECGGVQYVFYKCAKLLGGEAERKRVESALIYEIQPCINTQGKDSFPYEKKYVNTSEKRALIPERISVDNTNWEIDV